MKQHAAERCRWNIITHSAKRVGCQAQKAPFSLHTLTYNTALLNRSSKRTAGKSLFHSLHHLKLAAAGFSCSRLQTPAHRGCQSDKRQPGREQAESRQRKSGKGESKAAKTNGRERKIENNGCYIKAGQRAPPRITGLSSTTHTASSCPKSTSRIISIPLIVLLLGPVAVPVGSLIVVARRRTTAAEPR